MPARALPGLGLMGDWALGENGWKAGMDQNLRTISALLGTRVEGFVAALPGDAEQGDFYILTTGPNANSLAVRDLDQWVIIAPRETQRAFNLETGKVMEFNGTAWVDPEAGLADAIETAEQAAADAQAALAATEANTTGAFVFSTRALALLFDPDTAPAWIEIKGDVTPGDGNGGLLKKVVSEPAHPAKLQIAEGSWYEFSDNKIRSAVSIAAMKTMKGSWPIRVRSYYGDGEGGGGTFYPDLTDSATADNGGSVIVRADGVRMKRNAHKLRNVDVTEWGARPANADNSAIYSAIIAATAAGADVTWPKRAGTWIGNFVSAVGKAYRIHGGNNLFQNVEGVNQSVFKFLGTAALITTLTNNAVYGNNSFVVASSAALSATGDDLVFLQDQKVRPSDSNLENIEVLLTRSRSGNTVFVDDMIRSMQDFGTRNVYKIDPVRGVLIEDVNINIVDPYNHTGGQIGTHSVGPIVLWYSRDCILRNCHASHSYAAGLDVRYAYGLITENTSVVDGSDRASGAYGFLIMFGRKLMVKDHYSRNTRNVVDMSAVYDAEVHDAYGNDVNYGITIGHNRFAGFIRVIRPKIFDMAGGPAVFNGNQLMANPENYRLRDMQIIDVEGSFVGEASVSGKVLVYIQTSCDDLHVSGASVTDFGIQDTPSIGNAIVRLDGVCYGGATLENLHSPRAGTAVFVSVPATPSSLTGIGPLRVRDAHIGTGSYVVYSQGTKHIVTENLTGNSLSGGIKSIGSGGGIANVNDISVGLHSTLS